MASRPTCPYCGTSVSKEARYCDHCGTPLSQTGMTTPHRRRENASGRVAVWAFVLVLLLVFSTGTVGGYRYRTGRWPVPMLGSVARANTDMNGISLPQTQPDTSSMTGYLRSVVSINVRGSKGNKAGSGFLMSATGHVVTAAHVVEGASCVTVLDNNGRMHQGTVVGVKPALDVAMVHVPGLARWPSHLEFGDSTQLKQLDQVYVLGNPKGLANAIPLPAEVTQVRDEKTIDGQYFPNLIQFGGAMVLEGTSGGPLMEKNTGLVVGIVAAGTSGPVAYAVPTEEVVALLKEWTRLPVGAPCAPVPAARTTPVILAALAPLTSAGGIDGADMVSGVQLALRDMEEQLRSAGYAVSVKLYDDQGSAATGQEVAEAAAVNPSVIGVVGSLDYQVTYAVAEKLKNSGLVMVAPTSGAEELTTRGWRHVNRLVANSQRQEQAAARFAKSRLGVQSVFLIEDGTPAGAKQASAFKWAAQVIELAIDGETKVSAPLNYPGLREKILQSKAGAIYYAGTSDTDTGVRIAQALRQDGMTLPLLGGQSLFHSRFLSLSGQADQGVYFTRLTTEPSESFQKHFESVLGKPTRGYSAYGYDAASVILSALIRYGEANPGQIPPRSDLAGLVRETRGYPGRTSWITFDGETGENKTSWVYIFEWKKGVPELRENMQ